jgi:hypothetical protein
MSEAVSKINSVNSESADPNEIAVASWFGLLESEWHAQSSRGVTFFRWLIARAHDSLVDLMRKISILFAITREKF